MSNAPISRPATAGPRIRDAVEHRGVEPDRVRDVVAADHLDRERLAGRHVDRVRDAEQRGEDHHVPDLDDAGHGEQRRGRTRGASRRSGSRCRVWRFGHWSAMTPPNSPKTITGPNWATDTSPSQSGSCVSWRTSQPWATCCIHVPTSEISLAAEEQPVVAVAERARTPSEWRRERSAAGSSGRRRGVRPARRRSCGAGRAPAVDLGEMGLEVGAAALGLVDHRRRAGRSSSRRVAIWRSTRASASLEDRPALGGVARRAEALTVAGAGGLVLEQLADLGQAEPGVVAEALDEPEPLEVVRRRRGGSSPRSGRRA